MTKIIGVRFRQAGKIYHFAPAKLEIKINDYVIVETSRGVEYGKVVMGIKEVSDESITQPLKEVTRIVTQEDKKIKDEIKLKEKEAIKICKEKVRKHDLEMKVIDAEYTFDGNKLLFYFTADGRVDFRELVKDLASVFRTRIELRQIGVRDETKILGGIGVCGRELCCHKYLTDFSPVSIKMAKNQNLSLNPTKISGVCGRLMCCLSNEEETYEELNATLPAVGSKVKDKEGLVGEVQNVSILRQQVKVLVENKSGEREIKQYKVEELSFNKNLKEQLNDELEESSKRKMYNAKKNTEAKERGTNKTEYVKNDQKEYNKNYNKDKQFKKDKIDHVKKEKNDLIKKDKSELIRGDKTDRNKRNTVGNETRNISKKNTTSNNKQPSKTNKLNKENRPVNKKRNTKFLKTKKVSNISEEK